MSRLTRDGTAEPVSRDQILRHARGQGNIIFPVQLTTSRIGNLTRLIHTLLYVMTIHTYIHTYPDLLGGKTSLSSSNTQAISTTFKSSPSHVVVFDAHIQRIIVLATEETTRTQPVINHIDLSTANSARGHQEVRRSQRATSWSQPAFQTIRDPNRDKTLARPNQPRTSETYRRHDDVFGHELQI